MCREESNKFKEAGGVQDNLSYEDEDDKDNNGDDNDDLDDKVSDAALIAVAAEEWTRRRHNVGQHVQAALRLDRRRSA